MSEAENADELWANFRKQPMKQSLIPYHSEFNFYTFNGKEENKNIRVEQPIPQFFGMSQIYTWYSESGLSSDYKRLKLGILSSATHNPFPRKASYLNPASADENDGKCCDYSIDLNGDNKKEKVVFTLQRESEFYEENQYDGVPVTCATLVTDKGSYVLAYEKFTTFEYPASYATNYSEISTYAEMDVVPMDVDGDGKMELIVYCGYYGGGYVSMFQLREDGLHEVAVCDLGPYD